MCFQRKKRLNSNVKEECLIEYIQEKENSTTAVVTTTKTQLHLYFYLSAVEKWWHLKLSIFAGIYAIYETKDSTETWLLKIDLVQHVQFRPHAKREQMG